MTDAAPNLEAPIRDQLDLHARWSALMGKLGFSQRSLWMTFVDADRRMFPQITEITDIAAFPVVEEVQGLLDMCAHLLHGLEPGSSLAFLLSRPGRTPMDASDRAWARTLAAMARRTRVPIEPTHFANDHELMAFAPDDLAA